MEIKGGGAAKMELERQAEGAIEKHRLHIIPYYKYTHCQYLRLFLLILVLVSRGISMIAQ